MYSKKLLIIFVLGLSVFTFSGCSGNLARIHEKSVDTSLRDANRTWNTLQQDWSTCATMAIKDMLLPIYQDELRMHTYAVIINAFLKIEEDDTLHIDYIKKCANDFAGFIKQARGGFEGILSNPDSGRVWFNMEYMVHVESMDIELEVERLRTVYEKLEDILGEQPQEFAVSISIMFSQENSDGVYRVSSRHSAWNDFLAHTDLTSFDFAGHFEAGYSGHGHCSHDLTDNLWLCQVGTGCTVIFNYLYETPDFAVNSHIWGLAFNNDGSRRY